MPSASILYGDFSGAGVCLEHLIPAKLSEWKHVGVCQPIGDYVPRFQIEGAEVVAMSGLVNSRRDGESTASYLDRALSARCAAIFDDPWTNGDLDENLLLAIRKRVGFSVNEYRTNLTWIGGAVPQTAKYVPMPPCMIREWMLDLFQHARQFNQFLLPGVILIAFQLLHIHPFPDGNGRTVRALLLRLAAKQRSAEVLCVALVLSACKGVAGDMFKELERGEFRFMSLIESGAKILSNRTLGCSSRLASVVDSVCGSC